MTTPEHAPRRPREDRIALAIAGVTFAIALLIALHARPFNGPWYYPWPWGRLPLGRTLGVATMIAGQLGVIAAAMRTSRWLPAVIAIAVGSLALRVGACAMLSDPIGLTYAAEVTRDPHVGSFFSVAQGLSQTTWTLADYPQLMPRFPLHAMHKAPAPTLFWSAMLRAAHGDAGVAARVGAIVIGVLSAGAIPLIALLARQLGATPRAAIHAAAVASILPGAIVFFPVFDPAYTTWTLLGVCCWTAAVRGRVAWSVAFGAWLAATLFVVFNVLPIGLYLALLGAGWIDGSIATRTKRFALCATVALLTAAVGIAAMQASIGYDAIATLRTAMDQQAAMQAAFGARLRPYPYTIAWDLYDAALGVGYAPVLVALGCTARLRSAPGPLAAIGLTTWIIVAIASLLPVETARVWNFLFPLVALPAGWWLAERTRGARVAIFASMGLALLALVHGMVFMTAAPVITR